jgi:hypothetical protein
MDDAEYDEKVKEVVKVLDKLFCGMNLGVVLTSTAIIISRIFDHGKSLIDVSLGDPIELQIENFSAMLTHMCEELKGKK